MNGAPATSTVMYRPPAWNVPASERAALREIVREVLPQFEPVLVTHLRAGSLNSKLVDGFEITERYRQQLVHFGSVMPGEPLNDAAFASIEFRRKGAPELPLGVARYGDVAVYWKPELLETATLAPIASGDPETARRYGGGLQAGSSSDLVDVLTDTLVAQHTPWPIKTIPTDRIAELLALPRAQAAEGVAQLIDAGFHRLSNEAIVRHATADAITAVTILTKDRDGQIGAIDHAAQSKVRAWAEQRGIPVVAREL